MSALPGTGSNWLHNGHVQRTQRTTVTLKGVEVDVDYLLEGEFLPPTDIDDACTPTVRVLGAQIGGVDVWSIFYDTSLGERIVEAVERQVIR